MKTPVAFIVFKRPEVTRRVLAAIRAVQPPVLFVIADGPRANRSGEAEKCSEVRALIESGVDWPCDVRRNFSDINLGSALRVSSGLNWVFEQVEEAIILEDDCLPDPTFFPFCEQLLGTYRHDERVAQIAGCSFLRPERTIAQSYFFSRYPHCWGWATWRRAWKCYDHSMRDWTEQRQAGWKNGPTWRIENESWAVNFDRTLLGQIDAWDYRWTAVCWFRGVWSITPMVNLVTNLGFGVDATNTKDGPWGEVPVFPMGFPLAHPEVVTGDLIRDAEIGRLVFKPPGLLLRVARRIKRLLSQ